MSFYQIAKSLALLPASLIIGLLIAIVAGWRWPRIGRGVLYAVTAIFYLLAAPFSSNQMARMVATIPPLPADANLNGAQAIVVLAAGASNDGAEYGGVILDHITLDRLRYAAHLYRRTKLPILVSGGPTEGSPIILAAAMRRALEEDFGVPATWVEDRSIDTAENARFSAEILQNAGIKSIILVAHAIDMPRASALFTATGLIVTPAPTRFPGSGMDFPEDFIPRMTALDQSWMSIYEILASAWHTSSMRS